MTWLLDWFPVWWPLMWFGIIIALWVCTRVWLRRVERLEKETEMLKELER